MTQLSASSNKLKNVVSFGTSGLCLVAISMLFAAGPCDPDSHANAAWPDRLSPSVSGRLIVAVKGKEYPSPPRAQASVTLYQSTAPDTRRIAEVVHEGTHLRRISEAKTDNAGFAALQIPPVARSPRTASNDAIVCTVDPRNAKRCTIELIAHVVYDGDELYLRRKYTAPSRAAIALTTDRPLYQPGQTVLARLLAVDPDRATPVSGEVEWTLRDPQNNLVLKRTASTSGAGIATLRFPLADRCLQGQYRLTANFDGETTTQTLNVRPFRLPRFKVNVEPDVASVAPGGDITIKVGARYTYGDPVRGANVALTLNSNREGGSRTSDALSGTLEEGNTTFTWKVPRDAQPGSSIALSATVTSESGRAEQGESTVRVQGAPLSVELLSSQGDVWAIGLKNTGYVVVRDPTGKPVEKATVQLWLPESKGERATEVTTNAQGHATFVWTPVHSSTTVRIKAQSPQGDALQTTRTVQNRSMSALITTASPLVNEGEPVSIDLPFLNQDAILVATNRSYPIATAPIQRQQNTGSATITLGPEARGLTTLMVLGNKTQSVLTSTRVWVRQQGDEAVNIKMDAEVYKPGSLAKVELAFPAGDVPNTVKAPVLYGLIGVDEALYALMERLDAPLQVLLRQRPEDIGGLQQALAALGDEFGKDTLSQTIARSRFLSRLSSNTPRYNSGGDITKSVHEAARRPWLLGWLMVLLALMLTTTFFAGRAAWRAFSRDAWSWKSCLMFLGAGLLTAVVGVGMMSVGYNEQFFAGGLCVWLGIIGCWLVATAWRNPDLPLGAWLLSLGGGLFIAICASITLSEDNEAYNAWPTVVFLVGLGLTIAVTVFGAALWSFALELRTFRKPALGLASLLGLAIIGSFAGVLLTSSLSSPMRMDEKSMAIPERMTSIVVDADDGAPPPDIQQKKRGKRANKPLSTPIEPSVKGAAPRVRNYFPETMVWMPEVPSDTTGRANLNLELPDSITTWRLDVSASTWDGRLGQSRVGIAVKQPFFIELDLPTHLTHDDQIEVPITLVNNRDDTITATITAKTEGALALLTAPPEQLTLEPQQRRLIVARVQAHTIGSGSITLSATLEDGSGDAVQRSATIAPDGRQLSRSQSGIIGKGWTASLAVPQNAFAASVSGRVSLYPGVVADALDGLDSMLRGPTGCFEQTSSAHYPNVMVLRTIETTPPKEWPGGEEKWTEARTKARELVVLGVQRILSFRTPGGGFALYPNKTPDVMLTAYGLMQLTETEAVHPIDPNIVRQTAQWLASQQNPNGTWPVYARRLSGGKSRPNNDVAQLRSTAFVAWALASSSAAKFSQHAIKPALDHLAKHNADVSAPDTLAIAANALGAGKRPEEAKKLIKRLAATVQRKNDTAWWSSDQPTWIGGRGQFADIETTALAAFALLTTPDDNGLVQQVLRFLANARAPHGGWGTTQATVWTLKVLEKLRALASDGPVDVAVSMAGAPLTRDGTESADPLRIEPGDIQRYTFSATPKLGTNNLRITSSDTTQTMATARVEYAVPWTSPEAQADANIRLAALFETATRTTTRSNSVELGVVLTNPTVDPQGALIVELPLPPGAYVDPDQMNGWQKSGRIDRFEVLPTHIRLYLPGIEPKGRRAFTYQLIPLVRGSFSIPPVRAYVFYAPDPVTEVDSGNIVVK